MVTIRMAHELRVEGDKVIEQDDKGRVLSTKVSLNPRSIALLSV